MTNIWTKTEIKPDCVLTSFLRIVSYELAFLISAGKSPLAFSDVVYNTEQKVTIASRKVAIVRTNVRIEQESPFLYSVVDTSFHRKLKIY